LSIVDRCKTQKNKWKWKWRTRKRKRMELPHVNVCCVGTNVTKWPPVLTFNRITRQLRLRLWAPRPPTTFIDQLKFFPFFFILLLRVFWRLLCSLCIIQHRTVSTAFVSAPTNQPTNHTVMELWSFSVRPERVNETLPAPLAVVVVVVVLVLQHSPFFRWCYCHSRFQAKAVRNGMIIDSLVHHFLILSFTPPSSNLPYYYSTLLPYCIAGFIDIFCLDVGGVAIDATRNRRKKRQCPMCVCSMNYCCVRCSIVISFFFLLLSSITSLFFFFSLITKDNNRHETRWSETSDLEFSAAVPFSIIHRFIPTRQDWLSDCLWVRK